MKIIFLCGSLEPGRDGVGDYVRRLSGELSRQGHHTSAIALNDYYVCEAVFSNQISENISVQVLRLPSTWKISGRLSRAKQWIDKFNPDWISLQFVPFAFHTRGLPFFLSKQLAELRIDSKWHIMFHELWVGMEHEAPIKYRILGKAQEVIIRSLIRQLRPGSIHTQTHLYQVQLTSIGATVHSLPLFGNIPVTKTDSCTHNVATIAAPQQISFVLFGNIHYSSLVQQFTDEAVEYMQYTGTSLMLTLIGRCGAESEQWIHAWNAAGLSVEVMGEQSPACISAVLKKSTFGLATTPAALVEKSGTASAMREHGLRVICVGRPWHSRTEIPLRVPAGIAIYSPGNFKNCVTLGTVSVANENTVSFIANKLLNHLLRSN